MKVCDKCFKTFGDDRLCLPAEWVMTKESVLTGTERRVYVCDEHCTELFAEGWDIEEYAKEEAK